MIYKKCTRYLEYQTGYNSSLVKGQEQISLPTFDKDMKTSFFVVVVVILVCLKDR